MSTIFIAGGSGAIGRPLVPMLIAAGHRVVALTRSAERGDRLRAAGAEPVLGDVFDVDGLARHVADAQPEIVVHQLTAFGARDADPLAETIRVRVEGTRNLVAAARSAGARRFIAQSISFVCSPAGDGLTDEATPLYLDAPASMRPLVEAVDSLESQTLRADGMEGVVLRYGWFYGPGTNYDSTGPIPRAIRKGGMAIVGEGAGTYSFIHVDDAARATVCALADCAPGIYNVVDDAPTPLCEWLPYAAGILGGPSPGRLEIGEARRKLGDFFVYMFNEQRGASNAKAKRVLSWEPVYPTWRDGFRAEWGGLG